MRPLEGHTKDVRTVAYLPDGRLLSGSSDKTIRLWSPATGSCLTTIKAKGPVYAVASAPDSQSFAYSGRPPARAESNFVQLCDPAGKPLGKCELRTQEEFLQQIPGTFNFQQVSRWTARSIWSIAFSADGNYLAAACRRPGSANIPYGGGGRCWARIARWDDAVLAEDSYALAFAPTGCRLAVTRNKSVAFFDDPTRPQSLEYPLTSDWSAAVAFVPGAALAVVGANSFLDFLNPIRKEKPTRLKTGLRTVLAVAISPDGKTILVGGKPGAIEVYDVASRTRTTAYDFGIGGIYALAFAPDGLTFAAGGDKGLVVCDHSG
jgi:WD40 repeat protein